MTLINVVVHPFCCNSRETHGSGTNYHVELAKQLATFLEKPLSECGGMMTLADVYCRYNRARGMEVGLII